MRNVAFIISALLFFASCKHSDKDLQSAAAGAEPIFSIFKLQLSPTPDDVYRYDINSQSDIHLKAEGKEIKISAAPIRRQLCYQ